MNQTMLNTVLIVVLIALQVVSLVMPSSSATDAVANAIEANEALKVGGQDNYELLEELYADEDFQAQQRAQIQGVLDSIGDAPSAPQAQAPTVAEPLADDQLAELLANTTIIKGNQNPDILYIEYSDIECPFCKRHHDNGTITQVVDNYDSVGFAFQNFPLGFHAQAQHNAEAIECAKDQVQDETIYDFVEALFASEDITPTGTIAAAASVGLDADAIQTCMDAGDKTDIVAAQMATAQNTFGVNGTPGNVLINTSTGEYRVVSGAQPYAAFVTAIEELL
jgi:protein-disulfide isomerase